MYAIKNCSIKNERNIGSQKVMKRGKYIRLTSGEKKREENIFDQRVVKRKTEKYIRSTSGEKKERKIYAIKEWLKERQRNIFDQRVVKRKKGKYMRSNQGLVHDGAQGKCNHI